jgi:polyisoprenoid-binding protein YceI
VRIKVARYLGGTNKNSFLTDCKEDVSTMTTRRLWLAILALGALAPLTASAALSATGTPSVSFTGVGPGGLKIVGSTGELSVAGSPDTITVTVPLGQLTTGIGLRDSHMRDKYLQVATYPTATLTVPRSALNLPAAGAQAEGDATGAVTLHGQTHPAQFHYGVNHVGQSYSVNSTLRVNIKDHGIEVPVYLGIGMKPDVDVAVKFEAQDDP